MNTDNFIIEARDIENAQDLCKLISDTDIRNRAVANSFAANIAEKYFDKDKYIVDAESGLHNIDCVLKEIDISDIYVNNNYIDVRICFQGNELMIPQKHFSMGLQPFAYMFIEVTTNLSDASVLGFILSESVDNTHISGTNIIVDRNELVAFDSIDYLMEAPISVYIEPIEIYNFADDKVSDKAAFYKKLILSKDARLQLAKAVKAKNIFNFVSVPKNEDENLSIEDVVSNDNLDLNDFTNKQTTYEYPTEVEPESLEQEFELTEEVLEQSDFQDNIVENDISPLTSGMGVTEEETIDTLFNNTEQSETTENSNLGDNGYDENFKPPKKKSNVMLLALVAVLISVGAGAYYFFNQQNLPSTEGVVSDNLKDDTLLPDNTASSKVDVMPIETVEHNVLPQNTNEGNAVSLPAIEKNLDASILVSNLKIEWEVPYGYASNIATKKYFEKLGKIIQLNLKTELLLLSKPPITNKIAVELKYNKADKKFETTGITISSGEKSVDDLILQTVNKALGAKLNINTDTFANIQGSPVLIIHL